MRLIDADALKNKGYTLHRTYMKDASTMVYEIKNIDDIPTIEAEPVRQGRWLGVNPMVDTLICSECGENIISEEFKSNYCPNCGAKMEGQE